MTIAEEFATRNFSMYYFSRVFLTLANCNSRYLWSMVRKCDSSELSIHPTQAIHYIMKHYRRCMSNIVSILSRHKFLLSGYASS